jgi:DNA-binding transcriptional LysR family regulator
MKNELQNLKHRHIEVFRAVMRTGSATGAAHQLGITQPGVSKLIWQTEELCRFSLFERVNNRLVPTEKAKRLFEEAERLFVGMEQLSKLIARMRSETVPRSVIATVPVVGQEILPYATAAWLKDQPKQMLTSMRDAGGVLALVSSRHADIGFVMSFKKTPGIKSQLLGKTRVMCAISKHNPLSHKTCIVPSDFEKQSYISISRHEGQQLILDKIFEEYGVTPNETIESPMIMGAAAMANANVGITFADVFSARAWIERGLILKPFLPEVHFEYHAVWIDSPYTRLKIYTFLSLMKKTIRKLTAEHNVLIEKMNSEHV